MTRLDVPVGARFGAIDSCGTPGSVPWVGGFIAAAAALSGDADQTKVNELQRVA